MPAGARRFPRIRPDVVVAGLVSCVVAALACLQLFLGSDLGLGNNGDIRRVLCTADLEPAPGESAFGPVVFDVRPAADATVLACADPELGYVTSQTLLIETAILLDGLVPGPGTDLRVVGALSALLFGLGVGLLYLVLPGGRGARLLAVGVAAFLLLDVTYLHFFSSAYSETAGFLGLLWTTVALAWLGRGPMRPLPVLATVLAGVFLITAKSQLTPLAAVLVLALAARWIADRQEPGLLRRTGLAVGACLVLAVTGGSYLAAQGPAFRDINMHNLVMHSVLPLAEDPVAALEGMGLDAAMAPHAGTSAFNTIAWGSPEHEGFLADASRVSVARYVAANPSVAGELLRTGLRESTQTRLPYLAERAVPNDIGTYAATDRHDSPGVVLAATRDAAPVAFPVLWVAMSAWGFVLLAVRRFRERGSLAWALPLLFACASAVAQLVVALLGDGIWEISKHSIYVSWLTFLALALTGGSVLALRRRADGTVPEPSAVDEDPDVDVDPHSDVDVNSDVDFPTVRMPVPRGPAWTEGPGGPVRSGAARPPRGLTGVVQH